MTNDNGKEAGELYCANTGLIFKILRDKFPYRQCRRTPAIDHPNPQYRVEGDDAYEDPLYEAGSDGLLKAIEKYDPDKGAFSTYAWAKIRYAILDRLKQQSEPRGQDTKMVAGLDNDPVTWSVREVLTEDGTPPDHAAEFDDPPVAEEDGQLVAGMIEKIKRIVGEEVIYILLRQKNGYTFDEIAEELGMNASTVRSMASRAMMALKSRRCEIEEDYEDWQS